MIKASAAITLSCVVDVSATWRYYLLQSSTLTKPDKPAAFPPPSAWTDAEPDYTPGSTNSLYVVDLTEFSDGTWSYSAVSLSSAYEAAKQAWNKAQAAQDAAEAVEEELSAQVNILEGKIELRATKTEVEQVQTNLDNLQVGGVNLIRGTRALELNDDVFSIQGDVQPSELFRGCYTLKTDAAWSGYKIDLAALAERKDLKVGDILTYSIWTKFDATPIKAPSFSLFVMPVISGINGALVTPIVSTLEEWQNWRRLEYTFTVTEEFLSVTSLRIESNYYENDEDYTTSIANVWFACPKLEIGNRATDWTPAPEDVQGEINNAQTSADFATPILSDTPPEDAPLAGKLWIDESVTPSVWRKWRGADVTTDREYQETYTGGAPFVALDNAHGQLSQIAVTAGCQARQEGEGDPSPENVRAISGRDSVVVRACGKNLLPAQTSQIKSGVTLTVLDDGGIHLAGECTAQDRSAVIFMIYVGVTLNGQFAFSMGNAQAVGDHLQLRLYKDADNYIDAPSITLGANIANASKSFTLSNQYVYGWAIRVGGGATYDVTIYPQLEAGNAVTAFEVYRDMGGGTITPSTPLYGLPEAEDTVEVGVNGEVTITRRTGYIAEYAGESVPGNYISSTGGLDTGAQIVYALAAPETELLASVQPITPQRGDVHLLTDAGALTATIHGSGWETVNDVSQLRAGVRALETVVTQQADGLEVLVSEKSALEGRVTQLEFGVQVGTDGVRLGASDSDYSMLLDGDSLDIRQNQSVVASFAHNKMWTQAAQVRDYLLLGNYVLRKSADSGLAIGLQ